MDIGHLFIILGGMIWGSLGVGFWLEHHMNSRPWLIVIDWIGGGLDWVIYFIVLAIRKRRTTHERHL